MPVDVTTEVMISRSRQVVAEFAADPENAPRWYANISTVAWRTEPPIRVGSQMEFVARFLGRTLAYTYEVVDLVAGERLTMRTADGPFPMSTTYNWETVGDQTLMRLRNHGEPSGFAAVGSGLLAASMRRANRKDLDNLKRLLEDMHRN